MREKRYTVDEIAEGFAGKIVCFGVGNYFKEAFISDSRYLDDIVSNINFMIDNNARKMGGDISIHGRNVKIYTVEEAKSFLEQDILVLITVEKYEKEIISQLKEEYGDIDFIYAIWKDCRDYYREDKRITQIIAENDYREKVIPKIIHYCWFGKNKMPDKVYACIDSWKKYCPDYEIKLWNDDNFDLHQNAYIEEAYSRQKYAFVSDFARLYVLFKEGGIYIDSDVELTGKIDSFLCHDMFSGFEDRFMIPTGIMGARRDSKWCKFFLSYYDDRHFIIDGKNDETTNVSTITQMYIERSGKRLVNSFFEDEGLAMYPQEVFCPLDYKTGELNMTANTKAIHWFADSWEKTI